MIPIVLSTTDRSPKEYQINNTEMLFYRCLTTLMVNGLHLYRTSLTSDHSKRFTIWPYIHPFIHTFKHVRVRLPRDTRTLTSRGAGDRTSNPPVASQPALPPEPHAAQSQLFMVHYNEWAYIIIITTTFMIIATIIFIKVFTVLNRLTAKVSLPTVPLYVSEKLPSEIFRQWLKRLVPSTRSS